MENYKTMKRFILIIFVLCPLLFVGQGFDGGDKTFGVIEGTVNVSMYGGATYYLPIDIPQGVNGMQPDLGIVYNSQSGNGLLGYGWNINGISTINRTGSTLFHNTKMTAANLSDDDCFLLDGQRLILVGSNSNSNEYKTENDEFSKIVFYKENGYLSKCEVRLENGNIIKYGYTSDSRLMASDGNNVIKWMASSIADRSGNTISYIYETTGNNDDVYIKQISYTSNEQANLTSKYLVTFTYLNSRFDDYHYYIAGNKVNSDRILSSIDVSFDGESLASYDFSYDGNTNRMYNLLTGITYSRGGYSLDPVVIQWNTDDSDVQNNMLSSQEINSSILNEFTFVGDFNGDGYSDLLTVPYKPLYGYSGDITAKVYMNNQHGFFDSIPNNTLTLSPYLEWIHVLDINGDGYDDIVAQTLTSTYNNNNTIYNTGFVVYASQSDNGFSNVYNTNLEGLYHVSTGDFLGESRGSLLLLDLDASDANDDFYIIMGYPSIIHYDNGYSINTFSDEILDMGAVVAGDFNGDGKTEIVVFDGSYYGFYSFYKQYNTYRIASTRESFGNGYGAAYYSGDFNNDGKVDILFNGLRGINIALSTGSGFSDWIGLNNAAINNIVLPSMQTYKHSLNNVSPNTSYGVNFSDFDGDGKTDIVFYNGNNRPVFFRDFHMINATTNNGVFKIEYQANNSDINFKNQYFTIGNFLGEDHVSFIAVDPQNQTLTTDDLVKVFSLPSTNERFSVSSITDGFGKTTTIEYDYLMPGQSDFYCFEDRPYTNNVKPCPMPMMALKSYTQHIGSDSYTTRFKYGNALLHRTGRGFVNFENVEKTNLINNVPVKIEKCSYETATMGVNALALPQCDSTFVISNGNRILSETNTYTFQNVRCNRQQMSTGLRHIARPAMISQKTKHFNPDMPGQLLSVEISEYTYNYNPTSGSYSNSYGCTHIETGINGTDCNSVANCGYRNSTQISFNSDNYSNWIINRKSEEISTTEYLSKPTITRRTEYEYSTDNPYLLIQKTIIPGSNALNPLTVRNSYQYDVCGNVTTETISAPYGTQNEAPVVTSYTYDNYRLVTSKTTDPSGLAYQECFTYDKYDRITKQLGSNGLMTTYNYSDPFNTIVTKTAPDNTTTTEMTAWASSINPSPAGAVYYKYMQTTGGPTTSVFYDAMGNAIRTTTWDFASNQVVVDTYFDERQRLVQQSYPYFYGDTPQWTKYEYDDWGRITTTTYPDNTGVTVHYDGLTTNTTTFAGFMTRSAEQTTNYLGWVTSNTDASNTAVYYDYNSDGQIASMTTSEGTVSVEMGYDDAGNRVLLNDPDYGRTTYKYDAFGRLKMQTTPKSNRVLYSYDVLGRVTQKDVLDEATTQYQYNETSHKGTLASITHTGQTLNYTYDQYDRLVCKDDIRIDTSYSTTYAYGSNSKLLTVCHPSGYEVRYEYYPNGTLYKIKDVRDNTLWQTDDMNACGQLLQATTGNGAITTNKFDATTNRLIGSATSNSIQNFAYTFDGFGNLTSRTDSIGVLKTESFSYDNLDRLTSITHNNVGSTMVYDSYGRMTDKQKDGNTVFSQATFVSQKPHATAGASTGVTMFACDQTVEYNAMDKVTMISQDTKTARFTYGYDNQRIRMTITDTLTDRTKTKNYVGSCEFVDDNGSKKVYTYLSGPYGVFVAVVNSGGVDNVNYIYKDHLGSWTTITDSVCNIVERRSFDAWGNLRDPQSWSSSLSRPPKFDRGFTGHEHLYDFNLINMNGRMYDPMMSAFLSPDNYMQDPTSQQGFNRYAYCMYNPLKYVDPSGEQYLGWNGNSGYADEQAERLVLRIRYNNYLESMQGTWERIDNFSNSLWSQGNSWGGAIGGNGCHGGGGRPKKATTRFNRWQQKQDVKSDEGRCILTSLGSIMGGDSTAAWEARADLYRATFEKNPFDPNNLIDFINWNPDPEIYSTYECSQIPFTGIFDAMNDGYVVSFMCDFSNEMMGMFDLTNSGHFVNVSYINIQEDGCITIDFNDHPRNNYLTEYNSCHSNMFWFDDYTRFIEYNDVSGYKPIFNAIRIIKTLLILKP